MSGREHELKCWPEFYKAIESGEKTFEIREDDRCFRAGDILWLREWSPVSESYSNKSCRMEVTYLLAGQPWLPEDYVCMALRSLSSPSAIAATSEFVSVPREPTLEMWDAAWKSIGLPYRAKLSMHEIKTLFEKFHAAMLAAAPAPATEPVANGNPLLWNVHCIFQEAERGPEWEAQWRDLLAAIEQHLQRARYPNAAPLARVGDDARTGEETAIEFALWWQSEQSDIAFRRDCGEHAFRDWCRMKGGE